MLTIYFAWSLDIGLSIRDTCHVYMFDIFCLFFNDLYSHLYSDCYQSTFPEVSRPTQPSPRDQETFTVNMYLVSRKLPQTSVCSQSRGAGTNVSSVYYLGRCMHILNSGHMIVICMRNSHACMIALYVIMTIKFGNDGQFTKVVLMCKYA